jgi:ribosomal protein L36
MMGADDTAPRLGAGDAIDDLCRVCKFVRRHTIIVADPRAGALRVICDTCGSQHNYRGERAEADAKPRAPSADRGAPAAAGRAFPPVAERERAFPPMKIEASDGSTIDLELVLRRVLREESGLSPAAPADRWRGGEMVLRPGRADLQEKSWPIETFFHKVVMLRNRLRVLEQQINGAEIPEELKVRLQAYITGCYGTLTSFNVLFADEADRFQGSGGE